MLLFCAVRAAKRGAILGYGLTLSCTVVAIAVEAKFHGISYIFRNSQEVIDLVKYNLGLRTPSVAMGAGLDDFRLTSQFIKKNLGKNK